VTPSIALKEQSGPPTRVTQVTLGDFHLQISDDQARTPWGALTVAALSSALGYNGRSGGRLPEAIIAFDQVVFSYDFIEVLHRISFSLQRGEVVGLLGPNGAGKSTTIKIIAGILAPGGGTVSVAGLPLPERAVEVKQRIGYVPEAAILFESLTGQEFLELSGRLHGVEEDTLQMRIREILETFSLSSDRASRLDTYSKGMRQKVLIAAALLHNPELILLDEPLSGLDVNAAIMVKDLIAALAAGGRTVLYSSHVLDVVEKVCSRALIIHKGSLIADGTLDSLRASTGQESLEDVFRTLTHSANVEPGVARIVAALRS
jgi:ABC-2 type transport system ATP-binding protein